MCRGGRCGLRRPDILDIILYDLRWRRERWTTTASYSGNGTAGNGTFSVAAGTGIAATPGADGLVFNPNNGFLLVGGQGKVSPK